MNKIINPRQAIKISKELRDREKSVVLAGGVFDVLHRGHIAFLQKAKEQADILFVLVESNEKVKQTKGSNRPSQVQQQRSGAVATLPFADYVIPLPFFSDDKQYDRLVEALKPDIIATTKPDPYIFHKKRQAEQIGAKVIEVIDRIPNISSTNVINNV